MVGGTSSGRRLEVAPTVMEASGLLCVYGQTLDGNDQAGERLIREGMLTLDNTLPSDSSALRKPADCARVYLKR
jgi:hypothetical protein